MNIEEKEVTFPGRFPLSGTFAYPGEGMEPLPTVLFFPGSGQVDRDENAKQLRIGAFKELSDLFVSLGFATFRFDKRGVGKSGGDFWETGLWDNVEDGLAAIAYLKTEPRVDMNRLVYIGHSEGGITAPAVYTRHPAQGMILLAGVAESLKDTTAWQRETLARDLDRLSGFEGMLVRLLKVSSKIQKANDALMKKMEEAPVQAVIRYKGKKINAKWLREHYAFDVADALRQIVCPTLAITGSKDFQVKPTDVYKMKELIPGDTEVHIVENLTHILRKDLNQTNAIKLLKGYKPSVKHPLDAEVVNLIQAWAEAWKRRVPS